MTGKIPSPKHKRQRASVPTTALAKSVNEAMMRVTFTDGRVLCVPLAWFPVLRAATPEQRARWPALAGIGRGPFRRRLDGRGGLAVGLNRMPRL